MKAEKIRALVVALVFITPTVRSEGVGGTGVENLLWPAIIVAAPFLIAKDLIFGSDQGASRSADKEATKILKNYGEKNTVKGLYVGSLNLQWSLYGMLVESRLPIVEINTAGSAWLLSQVKEPKDAIAQALQHKYIRLALGERGAANCFPWKSDYYDFTTNVPVRPGTCLLVTYEDELASNLRLEVNTENLRHRELRWLVIDSNNKTLLSVPFWQSQTEGKPLNLSAAYRARDESSIFARVIKTLKSNDPTPEDFANSRVLQWIRNVNSTKDQDIPTLQFQGSFREPMLSWGTPPRWQKESWESAYRQAYSNGMPAILNNSLLLIPRNNSVGIACANRYTACDSDLNVISPAGVLTASYQKAHPPWKMWDQVRPGEEMKVYIAGRDLEGNLFWHIGITPREVSAHAQVCGDLNEYCYFYPMNVQLTSDELVILGSFSANGTAQKSLPRQDFELVVSLSDLPPLPPKQ